MSTLEILRWPDPRLTETCVPVTEITDDIVTLAADMFETMHTAEGRGLAASQVGSMVRMFVMDAGWHEKRSDPLVCINPMLQEIGEERESREEGCLSIPGVLATVSRPSQVQMVWTTLQGGRCVQSFDGFAAACVQHEIDDLDGIITFDHLDAGARASVEADYETVV